jgi:predicted transposase/invertase (TIGR01784 family)
MKTDTLFYRLFQRWPQLALELLGLDYAGDSYRFGSEEIKQTAFRLDGVFTPLSGEPEQPVIFAEVQYQPDTDFYGRFISEITLYLRLHKPGRRWLAFVIYPARSTEKPPSIEFEPFLHLPQLSRIYLEDYQDRQGLSLTLEFIRLIASSEAQAVDLARKLVERRNEIGPAIIDFIETILVYKLPTLSRQEIIAMLTLDNLELKQTRFYQEIAEEENGKGRQQESQRLVGRMMRHKFGGTPAVQQAEEKLPALSVEQLEELAEALLDLTDTQALTHWLAARLGHLI